ncbi:serine hydrolase domain-containing protein [Hespellia stercorisuis]|uniref:CubicO group peptidase, beta-lactamase class C family n=1 Tax=Hespellia stercorisuis DSM 15480 TaxID=1121950 RepID=A0A1M6QQP0_9FIRM|nr:serine hydrolase domain-containing protein [Hespellia stercorisuis]SHK22602.1 CubicO group peptidase, beta-lactamase class C family [Hespellia stercorisuis DSM 15480]
METTISKEKAKEIDDLIKKTFQSIPIDHLSITITDQEDELFSMNYGAGITGSSSFVLGSTSKAFTAVAMFKLLGKFSISIDTPICHYLPEINCTDEITIRDLLNHTSGIGTYETIDNLKFSGKYGAFEYSNANYNLIGSVIEVITGNTFSNYVETQIFTPLKMKQSFAFSDSAKSKVMQGYKAYFGFSLPYDTKVPNEYSWIQEPSGYLCSSTADMGKFLRYMMKYSYEGNQLSKIVKENGVSVKNSPAIEDIYINNDGIYSAGWINKTINNVDILYHTGKLSNFCSFSALIPDKHLGISITCNFGDFLVGTNQIEKLYEGITSILINKDIANYINPYDYFIRHSVINSILLILLMLCSLPFILYYCNCSEPPWGTN